MIIRTARRVAVIALCATLATTSCTFQGLNSLPLPGTVGRGPSSAQYRIKMANVGTLESNSPVMIGDVVVGSVGAMDLQGWTADIEVSIEPNVVVPANAVARVGQTSLLGSMHLSLDPPVGAPPQGRLQPGSTLELNRSSTYPSTEQTLSSLAAVVNGGALGRFGDVVHELSTALAGHEADVRGLLTRLDDLVGVFDRQRAGILSSLDDINKLAGTLADQRQSIEKLLHNLPTALDVLVQERPRITKALEKLGTLSDAASHVIDNSQADLVADLAQLEPALRAIADVGPDIDKALASLTTFPYSQGVIDRAVRGDYMNLFVIIDLTIPRLRRTMFLGTRWGQPGSPLTPAPGDPAYLNYTLDPLLTGVTPPVGGAPAPGAPKGGNAAPVLPVGPPQTGTDTTADISGNSVFAGPYPAQPTTPGGG